MAGKKKGLAAVEKAEAVLRQGEYGNDQPTLVVTTKLSEATNADRENRALAFRTAGEIELALAQVNDERWLVNAPHWGDEQRLPDGWRSTWGIRLEACDGAQAEVGMKALSGVAGSLREGKGVRR